jgi:hypothetical protein
VENTLTVARTIGIRFLALCASTLFLVCFTRGQSADEVHLSPQRSLNSAESTPDTTPAEGLTAPIPHSTPLRVNVDVVLVPVTVSDSENRPVTTLTKQDFALFEEDKRQEIRYFSTEEAPLSVAILLDVSKSMSDKMTPSGRRSLNSSGTHIPTTSTSRLHFRIVPGCWRALHNPSTNCSGS